MREVFEALANKENGKFKVIDEKHGGPGGSKFFVSHYYLEVEYKGHHILVRFELGNHNMAKIEMQLLPGDTIPDFLITSRSQYYRLFYRKANILKVESVNNAYKTYLEGLLFSTNLEMLARKNLFEPTITLRRESTSKVLLTEFYLGFGDKENVLYGLIAFYKNIIDRL